eukprot:scaffold91056_cov31-Tisochrysis_lutea.AAC.1
MVDSVRGDARELYSARRLREREASHLFSELPTLSALAAPSRCPPQPQVSPQSLVRGEVVSRTRSGVAVRLSLAWPPGVVPDLEEPCRNATTLRPAPLGLLHASQAAPFGVLLPAIVSGDAASLEAAALSLVPEDATVTAVVLSIHAGKDNRVRDKDDHTRRVDRSYRIVLSINENECDSLAARSLLGYTVCANRQRHVCGGAAGVHPSQAGLCGSGVSGVSASEDEGAYWLTFHERLTELHPVLSSNDSWDQMRISLSIPRCSSCLDGAETASQLSARFWAKSNEPVGAWPMENRRQYTSDRKAQDALWAADAVSKGVELARQGKAAEALASYNHALDLQSDCVDALVAKGACLITMGRQVCAYRLARISWSHTRFSMGVSTCLHVSLILFRAQLQPVPRERSSPVKSTCKMSWHPLSSPLSMPRLTASSLFLLQREAIEELDKALELDPSHANASKYRSAAMRPIGQKAVARAPPSGSSVDLSQRSALVQERSQIETLVPPPHSAPLADCGCISHPRDQSGCVETSLHPIAESSNEVGKPSSQEHLGDEHTTMGRAGGPGLTLREQAGQHDRLTLLGKMVEALKEERRLRKAEKKKRKKEHKRRRDSGRRESGSHKSSRNKEKSTKRRHRDSQGGAVLSPHKLNDAGCGAQQVRDRNQPRDRAYASGSSSSSSPGSTSP